MARSWHQWCDAAFHRSAKTWSSVGAAPGVTFEKLFIDQQQRVLLGGEGGVIGSSNDGGASWQFVAIPMSDPVTPVTGFYRYENVLIATSALRRLLVSNDDRAQWTLLQADSNGYFTAGSFEPVHGLIVFTTHTGVVLRSEDRGRSWQPQVAANGYISAISYDADVKTLLWPVITACSRVPTTVVAVGNR